MSRPLAERMRPTSLGEVLGQDRWLAEDAPLTRQLAEGRLHSLVLWGPPGCGKTTLARLLAAETGLAFVQLSAVLDGVKRLREVITDAEQPRLGHSGTLLFVDEIHRWNKAQQDALLPHVERGTVVLVGATTENPSFELNAALRSRLQIIRLDPLERAHVRQLIEEALHHPSGLADRITVDPEVLDRIAAAAAGDARRGLGMLEVAAAPLADGEVLTVERASHALARGDIRHDRAGDDHYDVLSALIKSMRGSDPDAAVYWLARLLKGGEDPVAIARRLVIFASEDVGNADPRSLQVAMDAADAARFVGMPEIRIVLAQAVIWLAASPKSNASYAAINAAFADVDRLGALPVPFHLRNGVTQDMKNEGFGVDYLYPHDHPHRVVSQQYLPDALEGQSYYTPAPHGAEKLIGERLTWWARKLAKHDD